MNETNSGEKLPERSEYLMSIDKIIRNKTESYRQTYGSDYHPQDEYFLPDEICLAELEKAKAVLEKHDKVVDYKLFETHNFVFGGVEIDVDGRRFAIPRDVFFDVPYTDQTVADVFTGVVTMLEYDKWPSYLKGVYDNIHAPVDEATVGMLKELAEANILDYAHQLAFYLKMGDVRNGGKNRHAPRYEIPLLNNFSSETEKSLTDMLSDTGLKIINTSSRSSADDELFGSNSKTEVDALMEAISHFGRHKPYVRKIPLGAM